MSHNASQHACSGLLLQHELARGPLTLLASSCCSGLLACCTRFEQRGALAGDYQPAGLLNASNSHLLALAPHTVSLVQHHLAGLGVQRSVHTTMFRGIAGLAWAAARINCTPSTPGAQWVLAKLPSFLAGMRAPACFGAGAVLAAHGGQACNEDEQHCKQLTLTWPGLGFAGFSRCASWWECRLKDSALMSCKTQYASGAECSRLGGGTSNAGASIAVPCSTCSAPACAAACEVRQPLWLLDQLVAGLKGSSGSDVDGAHSSDSGCCQAHGEDLGRVGAACVLCWARSSKPASRSSRTRASMLQRCSPCASSTSARPTWRSSSHWWGLLPYSCSWHAGDAFDQNMCQHLTALSRVYMLDCDDELQVEKAARAPHLFKLNKEAVEGVKSRMAFVHADLTSGRLDGRYWKVCWLAAEWQSLLWSLPDAVAQWRPCRCFRHVHTVLGACRRLAHSGVRTAQPQAPPRQTRLAEACSALPRPQVPHLPACLPASLLAR